MICMSIKQNKCECNEICWKPRITRITYRTYSWRFFNLSFCQPKSYQVSIPWFWTAAKPSQELWACRIFVLCHGRGKIRLLLAINSENIAYLEMVTSGECPTNSTITNHHLIITDIVIVVLNPVYMCSWQIWPVAERHPSDIPLTHATTPPWTFAEVYDWCDPLWITSVIAILCQARFPSVMLSTTIHYDISFL